MEIRFLTKKIGGVKIRAKCCADFIRPLFDLLEKQTKRIKKCSTNVHFFRKKKVRADLQPIKLGISTSGQP